MEMKMEMVFDDNTNGQRVFGRLWGGDGHSTSLILVDVGIILTKAE
jgi:hypothetical protein